MTAVLEVASGAFAAVGVADVIVRTGREIYTFLGHIADAPVEINKLCETIQQTTELAQASRQCLDHLFRQCSTAHGAIESLQAVLEGLNRELQSLKILSSRLRGFNTRWNRFKYVLQKRKIDTSLEHIERSKTLLAGALVVASRELSANENKDTLQLIRRCSNNLEVKAERGTRTLTKTLQEQHQETVRNHREHKKASVCVRSSQVKIISQQAELSRNIKEAQKKSQVEHQRTRQAIYSALQDITVADMSSPRSMVSIRQKQPFKSGRDVYFIGERRDMIMAYLLLVKSQLDVLVRRLLTNRCDDKSARHAGWLQSEFEHLVASAAHEASYHTSDCCESLDRWYYSEDSLFESKTFGKVPYKRNSIEARSPVAGTEDQIPPPAYKQATGTQRAFTHKTAFGHLRVHLPFKSNQLVPASDDNQTGFTLTCGIGQSLHYISGRFFSDITYTSGTRLCAQLNVFTVVASEDQYNELFGGGTVEQVDVAMRQGIISPYHVDHEGRNLCLYWAAEYARKDLLEYFDTQGVGVANLNNDYSLVAGFFKSCSSPNEREKLDAIVDFVTDRVYDRSFFLTDTTLVMLFLDYFSGRPRSLFHPHMRRLFNENLLTRSSVKTVMDSIEPWDWDSVSVIMQPLLGTGSLVLMIDSLGRNIIQRSIETFAEKSKVIRDSDIITQAMSAFIQLGLDIHHRDVKAIMVSMYARRCGKWREWCQALEQNGKCIEDVMAHDKTEWLMNESWLEVWKEKYGSL